MSKNKFCHKEDFLPVMEMFYSLQGEGYHTGKPAFFIRIGGCDVGCNWCDVKESWNANCHPVFTINKIFSEFLKTPANTVVITGGEPFLYNLNKLTELLKKAKCKIHVETSGTIEPTGIIDWISLSPKKNHNPLAYYLKNAHELKVIIQKTSDFDWAEENALLVNKHCKLFLQAEWSVEKKMLPLIINYIKTNTKWALSLQIHKYLNIP